MHRLDTPAAFRNPCHQLVLARSPLGRRSPSMVAARGAARRQDKDALAAAVRRHFNSMGVVENDVLVDFLYKVRFQGECKPRLASS